MFSVDFNPFFVAAITEVFNIRVSREKGSCHEFPYHVRVYLAIAFIQPFISVGEDLN